MGQSRSAGAAAVAEIDSQFAAHTRLMLRRLSKAFVAVGIADAGSQTGFVDSGLDAGAFLEELELGIAYMEDLGDLLAIVPELTRKRRRLVATAPRRWHSTM